MAGIPPQQPRAGVVAPGNRSFRRSNSESPIYDNALIWETVFKRFRNDFRGSCRDAGISYDKAINDDTSTFLLNYMEWASSLLNGAHPAFMQVFVDWLDAQPSAALNERRCEAKSLHATAFEMVTIGAAKAASSQSS